MKYSTYLLWCVACLEYPEQCWHNSRRLLTAVIRQERNKLGQADQGLLAAVTDHSATTRIAVPRSAVPEQILQGQGSHSTLPAVCWCPQVWLAYHASLEYLPRETGYKDTQLSFCCQLSLCGVRSARHPAFLLLSVVFVWSGQQDTLLSFCCQPSSLCDQVSKRPCFFLLL